MVVVVIGVVGFEVEVEVEVEMVVEPVVVEVLIVLVHLVSGGDLLFRRLSVSPSVWFGRQR